MIHDDEHDLPPEVRRRKAQLRRVADEIRFPLTALALFLMLTLSAIYVSRTPSAPRPAPDWLPLIGAPR